MGDRIHFFLNRLRERLWVRPLAVCILSVAGAFMAKVVDGTGLGDLAPHVNPESIETLLSILSSSATAGAMSTAISGTKGKRTSRGT